MVIDQGTFSTRALAFDRQGQIQAAAFCKVSLRGHGSDQVEQDANEILASVQKVVKEVLAQPVVQRLGVARAGLTTQRSSVVAWHRKTGQPLAPLLSWQDRRVADWLRSFNNKAPAIKRRTGLRLSPHYGAGKLRWYLDHIPAVSQAYRQGYLVFGPLASFLVFHLLKDTPVCVDQVNASRTQLCNLQTRNWDPWLLDIFGIPIELLPQCQPTLHPYGRLQMADILLTTVNGDQNSAIYSLGRPQQDTAIVNIGTGAFILSLTGAELVHHATLLSGLASSTTHWAEYLLEGTINGAGAALDWAAQQWNLSTITQHLDTWLTQITSPPVFINTIGGLGSPWWKSGSTPKMLGPGEPKQYAVAVAESILFMLYANFEAMKAAKPEIKRLQISGGLGRLNSLCQRLADLTQFPVYRPAETEATARGMAWLAAGQPAHWPKPGRGRVFRPKPNQSLTERYHLFRKMVDKS